MKKIKFIGLFTAALFTAGFAFADDFDFGLCHCATSVVGKLGGTKNTIRTPGLGSGSDRGLIG